ncbi:MAG: hypothetical protein COA78_15795 [Blastopirellula sp.]|nr:MAG: hypothetical protein COA78_15795 [Blastopirellula sp.]
MKILPVELTEAACYYCDPQRCKKIFDSGFDINTQDKSGETILMCAVTPDRFGDINSPEGVLSLVEFFIEWGADPQIENSEGWKAADFAQQFVDPNWKDEFGYSLKLGKADIEILDYIIELLEKW